MAFSSEIEKLERRWQENPLGLTFAPLAEAYRKAGDPARRSLKYQSEVINDRCRPISSGALSSCPVPIPTRAGATKVTGSARKYHRYLC